MGGGLALAGATRNHGETVGVGVLAVELKVGAQDAVGLGIWGEAVAVVQNADTFWHDGKDGDAEVALHVVHGFDGGVHELEGKGKS